MKKILAKSQTRRSLLMEALERRELMANLSGITANYVAASKTLVVKGSAASDWVSIRQNDSQRTLTLLARSGDQPEARKTFSASSVDKIVVQLAEGNDQFVFKTVGDVWFSKDVRLDLGDGDDTARFSRAEEGAVARADFFATIDGGTGDDAIGMRLGPVARGMKTSVTANLGEGNDGLGAQVSNGGASNTQFDLSVAGGDGDDQLSYDASDSIAKRSSAYVELLGQGGNDTLVFANQGRIDGALTAKIFGGEQQDVINASAVKGVGSGQAELDLRGNDGDDVLVLDVRSAVRDTYTVAASIDGGAGNDVSYAPDNAALSRLETSLPIDTQTRPTPSETFNPVLPTNTLTVGQRTIEYWSTGRSQVGEPVIVLISGAGNSVDSWVPLSENLRGLGMVVSVNKPGYGQTSVPGDNDSGYNDTVINDIHAVVARLAPGRQVILVGHSIGGAYANLYARLHPDEVAGVVFDDSTPQVRVDPSEIALVNQQPLFRIAGTGLRQEYGGLAESVNEVLDAPDFPQIPVIALSQQAEGESLAQAQELADLGEPGRLQIVPNAGHYLHADQPQIVLAAIRDMVQQTEISGILSYVADKYGIPGLAASVVIGNRVLSGVAGERAAGSGVAVEKGDRFLIGSDTKAMTATLAGVLVDRGVIHWEDSIGKLFPELTDKIRGEYLNVTLEQLLQHRGGIIADEDASQALVEQLLAYRGPDERARLALLPAILNEPAPVAVGTYRYSNAGYAVAAALMERATQTSYERLMQRFIFGPLDMKSAKFSPPPSDPSHPAQPVGHLPDGTPAPNDRSPEIDFLTRLLRPAGSDLRLSVEDWAKFVKVHLGQTTGEKPLLKPETLARLHQAIEIPELGGGIGYAMGWGVGPATLLGLDARMGTLLQHDGSDGLWLAEVDAFPDVDFSIQFVANATTDRDGNDLGSTAFAELRARLLHRFAPRFPESV